MRGTNSAQPLSTEQETRSPRARYQAHEGRRHDAFLRKSNVAGTSISGPPWLRRTQPHTPSPSSRSDFTLHLREQTPDNHQRTLLEKFSIDAFSLSRAFKAPRCFLCRYNRASPGFQLFPSLQGQRAPQCRSVGHRPRRCFSVCLADLLPYARKGRLGSLFQASPLTMVYLSLLNVIK